MSYVESQFSLMRARQVDIAMFRDLDSLLSAREKSAVEDWLQSKHILHVMRDHPGHDAPILAGMWGAKVYKNRPAFRASVLALLSDPLAYSPKGHSSEDQVICMHHL